MSINVFPISSTAAADPTKYVTAAAANTMYLGTTQLESGLYVITCASGTVTKIDFFDASGTFITNATTTSGTVTINLSTPAKTFYYWTNTGTNIQISITKSGSFGTFASSGTVTTYTNSQEIVLTAPAYAILVGAGGGGGGGSGNSGGQGGRVASLTGGIVNAGTKTLVVGALGNGSSGTGNSGGSTTFAGLTASGGAGGNTGGGSSPNDQPGYAGSASASTTTLYPFANMGTTGNGGGGGNGYNQGANGGAGGGSGVGTGGSGGYRYGDYSPASGGNAANGYGAGGGGGGAHSNQPDGSGGAGSPGVLYLIQ